MFVLWSRDMNHVFSFLKKALCQCGYMKYVRRSSNAILDPHKQRRPEQGSRRLPMVGLGPLHRVWPFLALNRYGSATGAPGGGSRWQAKGWASQLSTPSLWRQPTPAAFRPLSTRPPQRPRPSLLPLPQLLLLWAVPHSITPPMTTPTLRLRLRHTTHTVSDVLFACVKTS